MKYKSLIFVFLAINLNVNCDEEILAINCKLRKAKIYTKSSSWTEIEDNISCPTDNKTILSICKKKFVNNEFNYLLPIKSTGNGSLCFSNTCIASLTSDYQIYKCLNIINIPQPLIVQDYCIFKHSSGKCQIEDDWKAKAIELCSPSQNEVEYELFQLKGIFPCIVPYDEKVLNFKAIQFVCCPKMKTYQWYMKYQSFNNGTIKSEMSAYRSAKKSLREKFKRRQNRIKDRFILEEKSINMWSKHPKLALSVENEVKNRFRQSFMIEMNREVELLKELELIHENKMQKLYEKKRKDSIARLAYTLQETNAQESRVAKALELEFQSVIAEGEDIIEFLKTLYKENLDDDKRIKELIKMNFNNLIINSWEYVINIIKENDLMKGEVSATITKYELKREFLLNEFRYLNNDYIQKGSMKAQADNFIKNVISSNEHGSKKKESHNKSSEPQIVAPTFSIISVGLAVSLLLIVIVVVVFVFFNFSHKIMYNLSNVFKKIHPQTRNVFVQIDTYPFKKRYNYSNSVSQSQCKTEESFLGGSPSYNYPTKSADQSFPDSSLCNINGLENPICRLLDEK